MYLIVKIDAYKRCHYKNETNVYLDFLISEILLR